MRWKLVRRRCFDLTTFWTGGSRPLTVIVKITTQLEGDSNRRALNSEHHLSPHLSDESFLDHSQESEESLNSPAPLQIGMKGHSHTDDTRQTVSKNE